LCGQDRERKKTRFCKTILFSDLVFENLELLRMPEQKIAVLKNKELSRIAAGSGAKNRRFKKLKIMQDKY